MSDIYRHLKTGGLYKMVSEYAKLEGDLSPVVVYKSLTHGTIWVRPKAEFFDGRFEHVGNELTDTPDFMGDIKDFHEKFDLVYDGKPRILPHELASFRHKFMKEEIDEWITNHMGHAITRGDAANYTYYLGEQLDALVDLAYVLFGTAYLQGFAPKFNEAWRRVHEANMKKVRAQSADQSKRGYAGDVVKPEGWEPPCHDDLVEDHAMRLTHEE